MIDRAADATSDATGMRQPRPREDAAVQAIWQASFDRDNPNGLARGGWSLVEWATQMRVLDVSRRPVGVAAVRAEQALDGATPARVALLPEVRFAELATRLVDAAIEMVWSTGGRHVRLWLAADSHWAADAAEGRGFTIVRTIADMQLPASVVVWPPRDIAGLTVRAIADGEDGAVLRTLNRNWAGTWNFVPITAAMVAQDLRGQREGMLLGVDGAGQIVATCHAVFEARDDSAADQPRAWISNVTVAPEWRGRGVARAMLLAGLSQLRQRGAGPIGLGVDAGNPAPFHLYQSVGFEVVNQVRAWDLILDRDSL